MWGGWGGCGVGGEGGAGEGGYAKELSEEGKAKQQAMLADELAKAHVIITTALIPCRPAPVLVTEEVVKRDASERMEIIPAKYEWVRERVLVKEASERLEIVPATYEKVEERVMVTPETSSPVA